MMPDDDDSQVKELAQLVKKARHLAIYTGAGVSTAADIPGAFNC